MMMDLLASNSFETNCLTMKTVLGAFALMLGILSVQQSSAQCAAGLTNCSINWDYLDFFPSNGYSTYANLSRSQTQQFALGTQRATITHNYTGLNAPGENIDHTGEGNSYGVGADVQFLGNGTITMSFPAAVQNVRFSLYDIDYNQQVTITALNGALATNVTMSKPAGATQLSITGSGTTTATATGTGFAVIATNSPDGTVNVDVPSPVTSITITISNTTVKTNGPANEREDGSFWLSDISVCAAGAFTANYYQAASPLYTNQPGYVISVRDNNFYYVNYADGKARFLFRDAGHTNMNSVAYDPVNKFVYYVYSLTGASNTTNPNNKVLRRYDYNMDTLGIVLNDITSLIPTFESGVESGAAAFYDGALYIGVEADNAGTYESIVWKIEFDASFAPMRASQVFAIPANGHDWADLCISNGVLYDFNGAAGSPNFYHMNLFSHDVVNRAPTGGLVPRQASVDWTGQVYNVGQPATGTTGQITPYDYNGGLVTAQQRTITFYGTSVTGSWGDAAEAFRPKVDFGDAPASYDPIGADPAVTELDSTLRLGTNASNEWLTRGQTEQANSDNFDDALAAVPVFNPMSGSYSVTVLVLNNTGANATLGGWLDYNGNGVFDAGEGVTTTVTPGASAQSVSLFWPGVLSTLNSGTYTYLRLRLTSAPYNMTTANATGYFYNGEVEDYRVMVNSVPLDSRLLQLDAIKGPQNNVSLKWQVKDDETGNEYSIERSAEGSNWTAIGRQSATAHAANAHYSQLDKDVPGTRAYYRVKLTTAGGRITYSALRRVDLDAVSMQLQPNPATGKTNLVFRSSGAGIATVQLIDMNGKVVLQRAIAVAAGNNVYPLQLNDSVSAGIYTVQLIMPGAATRQTLVVRY